MISKIMPLLIGLISLSCTNEKTQETSRKQSNTISPTSSINASSTPGSSTPSPTPLDSGCIRNGARPNICVLTAAKTYESRDPNFNKRSCWLRDSESEVDGTFCSAKPLVELRLGDKCGGNFKNFGFIDPPNELIGKICDEIRSPPDHTTITVDKRRPVSGEKSCAELGLKSGEVCPRQGVTCSFEYDVACKQLPQKPNLRAAVSLTCQPSDPDVPCPESTVDAKKNIVYLDEARRKIISEELLNLKLANYEYKSETGEPAGLNLGFIIEDTPNASFIIQGVKRVNLYTYISSAVATIQLQENRIKDLEAAVARLEKANRN